MFLYGYEVLKWGLPQTRFYRHILKQKYGRHVDEEGEIYDLEKIAAVLKKKVDISTLKKVRTMLDNSKPENLKTRYVKKIYDHILSLHIDQPSTFNKTSRSDLSEQDFQIKFWGPIFEGFFYSAKVVLHWGDTVSTPCKAKKIGVITIPGVIIK